MSNLKYRHIASLGSSFASGPGIEPMDDKKAMRSAGNYAHLLADSLGAKLTDLSIGGATTSTILDVDQRLGTTRFPPQIEGLPADADLVTITAGGNDLRYAGSLIKAGWAGWFQQRRLTRALGRRLSVGVVPASEPDQVERAALGLARVVNEVRLRAPLARILLVDYLTIIGPDTVPSAEVPFGPDAIDGFRRVGLRLNEAFAHAANQSSAELIRVSDLSSTHAVGSPEPWVVGFAPTFRGITAFHPNADGMRAVAKAIEHHLETNPAR